MENKETKKQFLINQFGEERLNNLLTAVDKFCEDNSIQCYELIDLASLYRKDKLGDIQHNRVISVQLNKDKSKREICRDYLYKQLDKLSKKKHYSTENSLAEDSLAMLKIVKYLDKEKTPKTISGCQERNVENVLNKSDDELFKKLNEQINNPIL